MSQLHQEHHRQGLDAIASLFHELMAIRVTRILLVLCPYDAFLMEDGGSFTSRIVSEYRGLNLSHPPRIIKATSGKEALDLLQSARADLVITTPQLNDMEGLALAAAIKEVEPRLPVILMGRDLQEVSRLQQPREQGLVDRVVVWTGHPNFLLALVKNVEDHLNADRDTRAAMVRVILLVEDDPLSLSFFLPQLYHEVVRQTQAVMNESLTPEQRLLKMRARPKILVAGNYEAALQLYERYRHCIFAVLSDTRFPRTGKLDDRAGIRLLKRIRREFPGLPLLLMSSEEKNRLLAEEVQADFLNKNSAVLMEGLHHFLVSHLGFGAFVFRLPDRSEVGRAATLAELEEKLAVIPEASLVYHARSNHFSHWIMARSEVELARLLHSSRLPETGKAGELRQYLIRQVHGFRKKAQRGLVARFSAKGYEADIIDFARIGTGSMGGKAFGLAFISALFRDHPELTAGFAGVTVSVPRTLVITTDGFEAFISGNNLQSLAEAESDEEITAACLAAELPSWLLQDLRVFLGQNTVPLSVRSSSMLEDLRFRPYAGLFETVMLPNIHPDLGIRLAQLGQAIKLVYASAFYAAPKAFSRAIGHRAGHDDGMAVLIQHLCGKRHGRYFYPDFSGVGLSRNYYPVEAMRPEDGAACIALGFGKTVVEEGKSLFFCPRYPRKLPQFSSVDDILANSQQHFYALDLKGTASGSAFLQNSNLEKRKVAEAEKERPVMALSSTYDPAEHRIRDGQHPGPKVITFAGILKHGAFPLPELLTELLDHGKRGLGCPVEMEFAGNLGGGGKGGDFYFLQLRPMAAGDERLAMQITGEELAAAVCFSNQALGHGRIDDIRDILLVKPESFSAMESLEIAGEIGRMNRELARAGKPYLLIGPGRWGSLDRLLGIPVKWQDIHGVRAIIELRNELIKADPSQGTHFFQNITSQGIPYITVTEGSEQFLDRQWFNGQRRKKETAHLVHLVTENPLVIKVDGARSTCVILPGS